MRTSTSSKEIAKFRAARRIWARWLRDRYGAKTVRAQSLRFHTQTAGVSLTAQQPYNNVVRTAIEALAAVLGGTNSLHTNALDETLALPTEESAEIALRTQQVLAEETGVVNVVDPLGGSWYVEALTDKIEAEACRSSTGSRNSAVALAGSTRSARSRPDLARHRGGWFTAQIADSAFRYQTSWRRATRRSSVSTCTPPPSPSHWRSCGSATRSKSSSVRLSGSAGRSGRCRGRCRTGGDDQGCPDRWQHDRTDAGGRAAEATLGEICNALRAEWGEYVEQRASKWVLQSVTDLSASQSAIALSTLTNH